MCKKKKKKTTVSQSLQKIAYGDVTLNQERAIGDIKQTKIESKGPQRKGEAVITWQYVIWMNEENDTSLTNEVELSKN